MNKKLNEEMLSGFKLFQEFHKEYFELYNPQKAFTWMIEEVGELARAIRHADKDNQIEEIGHILVWMFHLSNSLDIDIEDALKLSVDMYFKKYGTKI